MAGDAEQKARVEVRRAQAEFEREQEQLREQRARSREKRRERFAKAQQDGLTVRDIADETGLGFGRVAEILRGE